MTYRLPGAIGITRVRLTRRRKRILLVLLSGRTDLHARNLCRLARAGSGSLYPFLHHLEKAGWVLRGYFPEGGEERFCYGLTRTGREQASALLHVDG